MSDSLKAMSLGLLILLLISFPTISTEWARMTAELIEEEDDPHYGLPDIWDGKQVVCIHFPQTEAPDGYEQGRKHIDFDGSEFMSDGGWNESGACIGGFSGHDSAWSLMNTRTFGVSSALIAKPRPSSILFLANTPPSSATGSAVVGGSGDDDGASLGSGDAAGFAGALSRAASMCTASTSVRSRSSSPGSATVSSSSELRSRASSGPMGRSLWEVPASDSPAHGGVAAARLSALSAAASHRAASTSLSSMPVHTRSRSQCPALLRQQGGHLRTTSISVSPQDSH